MPWRFPHNNLPPLWNESFASAIRPSDSEPDDVSKSVTLHDHAGRAITEKATRKHIFASRRSSLASWQWDAALQKNQVRLQRYQPFPNIMLMREDLYTGFDQYQFVFVLKAAANEPSGLVTQLLRDSQELGRLYHRTKLQAIDGVAPEFLSPICLVHFFRFFKIFFQPASREIYF